MKARVLATVSFAAGHRLALSEGQAKARRHALKKVGNGSYITTAEVQFKAGETIGVEGDLPKALQALVDTGNARPARGRAVAAPDDAAAGG
mgnify:FL=1